jgi:hypothetical protein
MVKEMVRAAGYSTGLAVTCSQGKKGLNSLREDPYELKRIYVSNQPHLCVFALQVSGIADSLRNIFRRRHR